MKKHTKLTALLLSAAMLLALLASCGGDRGSTPSDPTSSAPGHTDSGAAIDPVKLQWGYADRKSVV